MKINKLMENILKESKGRCKFSKFKERQKKLSGILPPEQAQRLQEIGVKDNDFNDISKMVIPKSKNKNHVLTESTIRESLSEIDIMNINKKLE